jgi:hypothetical protein
MADVAGAKPKCWYLKECFEGGKEPAIVRRMLPDLEELDVFEVIKFQVKG